jgi:hypothetical protein
MMVSKFPLVVVGGVFAAFVLVQGEVADAISSNVRSVKVLGQGSSRVSDSTLANISSMPLVSVGTTAFDGEDEGAAHGIDESLFYSATAEQVQKVPVAPVVIKPEFNVANEIKASVRLEAVFSAGAIINAKFSKKGDAVATVRDKTGEPAVARLVSIGADYVVISAAGVQVRVHI